MQLCILYQKRDSGTDVTFVKFSDFTQFFAIVAYVFSVLQTYRKENFVKYILILTLISRST